MTDAWRHPSQRTNIATGDGTAVLYRRINDITDIDTKIEGEILCAQLHAIDSQNISPAGVMYNSLLLQSLP